MRFDLANRLQLLQLSVDAKPREPLKRVFEWSVVGQLLTFFRTAAEQDAPDEYLTADDLQSRFHQVHPATILSAVSNPIRGHAFEYRSAQLRAGPLLNEVVIRKPKLNSNKGVRRNSKLEQFLVHLKSYPDQLFEVQRAPCAKGDFPNFASYPIKAGLIEFFYIGGKRYVRATQKLMESSDIQSQQEVLDRVYTRFERSNQRFDFMPFQSMTIQEFKFLKSLVDKHKAENAS